MTFSSSELSMSSGVFLPSSMTALIASNSPDNGYEGYPSVIRLNSSESEATDCIS